MKAINFDMDGTIVNLYGYQGWLEGILNEETKPYTEAKPLINMNVLARELNKKIKEGYEINVITWTAKNGTEEYNARVATAKAKWLAKHLGSVHFTAIKVLPYGTPKHEHGNGILFDDEEQNRIAWTGEAYNEKNIIETIKKI